MEETGLKRPYKINRSSKEQRWNKEGEPPEQNYGRNTKKISHCLNVSHMEVIGDEAGKLRIIFGR